MVVYALIWIKLPTALLLLAKNSPSSSRLWLHSNYTADWNEPAWGREREEGKWSPTHAPPRLHGCPWDPEIARVFEPKADMLYFSPDCTKLFANSLVSFRKAIVTVKQRTVHRFQQDSSILQTFLNKFLLVSSIVGTLTRNLYFSACVPSLDLPEFLHGKIWNRRSSTIYQTKSCK